MSKPTTTKTTPGYLQVPRLVRSFLMFEIYSALIINAFPSIEPFSFICSISLSMQHAVQLESCRVLITAVLIETNAGCPLNVCKMAHGIDQTYTNMNKN